MKILIATDSFKSSMTSKEIADIIQNNVTEHSFIKKPLADGGEGSVETLQNTLKLEKVIINTLDTYQKEFETYYLFDSENKIAYIETAMICGIENIATKDLDIMNSSSIGVGIAMKHAIDYGAKEIYLFLGGTASNDGGLGLLKGLDYKLLNLNNEELDGKTNELAQLSTIIAPKTDYSNVKVHLISDVNNPLLGELGATYVYGKQKGGSETQLDKIEESMKSYQKIMSNYFEKDLSTLASAGAAGGLPFSIMNVFDFKVESGIDFFIELLEIEDSMEKIDLLITGEGKIDAQSFQGKTISRVIDLAKEHKKPYFLICGLNEIELNELKKDPLFKGILELSHYAKDSEESIKHGASILAKHIKGALSHITK